MDRDNEIIKIAGVNYDVLYIPDLRIDENCTGKADFAKAKILLDDGMSPAMSGATKLHEVIEIINVENQLGLKHRQIQALATQLYQVHADNPKLLNGREE